MAFGVECMQIFCQALVILAMMVRVGFASTLETVVPKTSVYQTLQIPSNLSQFRQVLKSPKIVKTNPQEGELYSYGNAGIIVQFDSDMDFNSIATSARLCENICLEKDSTNDISVKVSSFLGRKNEAVIYPLTPTKPLTPYMLRISAAKSLVGIPLVSPKGGGSFELSFWTQPKDAKLSLGDTYSCHVTPNSKLVCWGYGPGDEDSQAPHEVNVGSGVIQVAVGYQLVCALLLNRTVQCWGNNALGALGDGTTVSREFPAPVLDLKDVVKISIGTHSPCALLKSGIVKCWGKLGMHVPTAVPGISDAVDLALGTMHGCVLRKDRTVVCWGGNSFSSLGNGNLKDSDSPVKLYPAIVDVMGVSSKNLHSCAIEKSGEVNCWGSYGQGQAGTVYAIKVNGPELVPGISDAKMVSTGGAHTCVIRQSGDLLCWGRNSEGQLGNGSKEDTGFPSPVSLPSGVVEVALGINYSCARYPDNKVFCWGENDFMQLGVGNKEDQAVPVEVIEPDFSLIN